MNKPHKHAAIIKAWADGAIIQYQTHHRNNLGWRDVSHNLPTWNVFETYRIKPERVFPTTSLTPDKLVEIWNKGSIKQNQCFIDMANAVIKQHILDTEAGVMCDEGSISG